MEEEDDDDDDDGDYYFRESSSIKAFLISLTILVGLSSGLSLKMLSTTVISVVVVFSPQKAHQSLATIPAPTSSDPLLTVPATTGTWRIEERWSCSSIDVFG